MARPAVGNTNFGMRAIGSAIGEATGVQETSNLSLKGLCDGTGHTFAADGGKASTFDLLGGSNNPIVSTAGSVNLYDDQLEAAPFKMSECIGGQHT
tara:strand:+ start:389 stop:676 length:288 start_codon:yes stop_codon:yes gene_type:complete